MNNMLQPGATIGILGGGQLGRMLALAAHKLGLKAHIYCPDPQSPAFEVTPHKTVADYEDEVALKNFAEAVDLVTYEFENVPAATAQKILELNVPLAPGTKALATAQDRLTEKSFIEQAGVPVAPFANVESQGDLEEAVQTIGLPAVLKTRRFGYDGKGQLFLHKPEDVPGAFKALGENPCVLEGFVAFDREISVIIARSANGDITAYDPAENVHQNAILHTSTVPANISDHVAQQAVDAASKIATSLNYVGVMGVEFFVSDDNAQLVVNEIAPRVHNSGHWTEAACVISQFEQHIRAIANWPLGDTSRHSNVVMTNLLGENIAKVTQPVSPGAMVHHYGKYEVRPGRKLGHINQISPKID
ncbi:5-(carboxyamino)imidazole ribonucleotide synthase [Maritalea mediterranea]|uniref:N5-carboxyaminoimidazole ribonucleotide synthase n=1 Tax=Maritalea mediterranea TaxID=2909667 RepID=A0ABS9E9T8_9HYPH|nr:5-(carboxyamino)imidazole ribonucleotide synthase [Maritalea mediterranea]MCF4099636.1 5-(carboxyamino)imidazole ribonucleotide synthase [Maritalea mediterranea]